MHDSFPEPPNCQLISRKKNNQSVLEKLMHKMSVQAPPKLTLEKYLIEIAKYYNVDY